MKVNGRKIYNMGKGYKGMVTEMSIEASLCVEQSLVKANINSQMVKYIKAHSTTGLVMVMES
jgi:hypothetical protein